jgi:hypothetical protein
MKTRWIRKAAGVAVVAMAASIGTMAAGAEGEVPDQGPPTPRALATSPAESVLVPIAPCRIVNTQNPAGKVGDGEVRSYRMAGNTASQGGAAACGIPAYATALEVSVTAVLSDGPGYLRLFPTGQPEPNATFLNYGGDHNIGNVGTIQVTSGLLPNFSVKAYRSPTHVVIDVTGYYATDLSALVLAQGGLWDGNGVTDSYKESVGDYRIRFDRTLQGCAMTATNGSESPALITARHDIYDLNTVRVQTYDLDGDPIDKTFQVQVDC